MRLIDDYLREIQKGKSGKDMMIPTHGNRFILHRVFINMPSSGLDINTIDLSNTDQIAKLKSIVMDEIEKLKTIIARDYASSYLNSLFKNASKCKLIDIELGRS